MAEKTAKKTDSKTEEQPKTTKCPITREQFEANAKPLVIKIGDESKIVSPKEFSTGSLGWFNNEKITVMVGDIPVKVQANIQLTVVGSKEI